MHRWGRAGDSDQCYDSGMANAHWIGMQELKLAVARNPQQVVMSGKKFLQRGMAAYRSTIRNSPWRMGMAGGGAPVALVNGGNLRDKHVTDITNLTATIGPRDVKYASYVHGIDGWPRKRTYQLRPWLDYAKRKNKTKIEQLYLEMLTDIRNDLAR